jgi:microcystin-dependent protein
MVDFNIIFYKDFDKPTGYVASLILKYDNTGRCLWATKLGATNYTLNGNTYLPVSEIDADGNFYLAVQVSGGSMYIYDTRNDSDYRFNISIPDDSTYNTFFAKYNKNGIIQWYNFISGYNSLPSISIDKTFISSSKTNNICISGTYTGDEESGNIYLYNAANNGDSPYNEATLTSINNYSFVAKFDDSGNVLWCSKVGGSSSEINSCVHCTADGHVYLGGDFIGDDIDVYQGWTVGMNPNTDISTTIYNENSSTYDIFLVKYNRYGIVNNSNPRLGRECYIHNDISIPDGTEKTIVVKNNYVSSQLQQILLIILNYNYPGYSIDRTIFLSEGITLVSYGGKWFVKSSSSNDALPKKSIVMWGGNQNDIPFGWALCNGQTYNEIITPDLRGRFVLGYNNNVAGVNGTSANGGQTNIGTNARVDYTLCNTVGNIGGEVLHTLTNSEMPQHNHGGVTGEAGWAATATDVAVSLTTTFVADDSGNHTHTISNDGGSSAHNNIPPFYVLCYIMKCY